jgi:hypothetical protein
VAGDEQVPADPIAERIHCLRDVPWHVTADVHDRVPAAGVQRRVVTGIPVADAPRDIREQVGAGHAPAE